MKNYLVLLSLTIAAFMCIGIYFHIIQSTSTVKPVQQNVQNNHQFDLREVHLQQFVAIMKQHQILAIETKQHADEGTLIEHPSSVTNNAVLFTNKSVFDFNCNALIKGDKNEIHKYITYVKNDNVSKLTDVSTKYVNLTSNCTHFVTHRGYITDAFTEEEKQFPIAFSILIHTEVKQAETLLRAIYRPQNLYCIHVDTKSSAAFYEEIHAISSCFDNVFLSSQRFDVKWGTMSVLEPEIECMKDLWNKSVSWKYFINLTGQEFPLRTNFELVKILKAYNGANDIYATVKRVNTERLSSAGPAPHNIRPSKGAVHIAASRGYVDYLLHDQRAKDLLEWTRKTDIPDETYFSTLNSNPHLNVPGSYNGSFVADLNTTQPSSFTRYKLWIFDGHEEHCQGQFVRNICIFGVGDLPGLAESEMLFANKFFLDFQPLARECLDELLNNRTREEYLGNLYFNDSFYAQQDFVINQVRLS
ncbi:beta-1,3-galactosyl-O-glycosyl-glycoprotein beta-1,6-N-acetylglucosaminyltransferase-like [Mya arenaria]|uniref:beta-1,3-galactosyl-O-glycosyl-glycoprotein beta-1,6-N-acetylglucosaminyltransferase-like n=1 Tax=Mya arenaria TaxID=6604 RepID=UPI0022E71805|nr:beta-1,3-galactosyl-O-glycosyl-glycoprotein beta-1,6-N-acetylglucosaminyltransferase-like [Mya arenaria]